MILCPLCRTEPTRALLSQRNEFGMTVCECTRFATTGQTWSFRVPFRGSIILAADGKLLVEVADRQARLEASSLRSSHFAMGLLVIPVEGQRREDLISEVVGSILAGQVLDS